MRAVLSLLTFFVATIGATKAQQAPPVGRGSLEPRSVQIISPSDVVNNSNDSSINITATIANARRLQSSTFDNCEVDDDGIPPFSEEDGVCFGDYTTESSDCDDGTVLAYFIYSTGTEDGSWADIIRGYYDEAGMTDYYDYDETGYLYYLTWCLPTDEELAIFNTFGPWEEKGPNDEITTNSFQPGTWEHTLRSEEGPAMWVSSNIYF